MTEERTERQIAAATTWLLLVNGCIDRRRYNAHQLSVVVGVSIEELEEARQICETQGFEALQPREDSTALTGRTESRAGGRGSARNTDERECAACGEVMPIDKFPPRSETDKRPGKLCELCTEFRARDHWVRLQKGHEMKTLLAYFTTVAGDPCIGVLCPNCEKPIEEGQWVSVESAVRHVDC